MRFAVSPLPRCLGFWAVDRSSFLSCRLAVSEIRSVQAKLCHHVVKAVGLFLACANPLQHCSAHVGVLQVIDAGLDELPQVVALRAARGLSELIQPRFDRWVQPDGRGHATSWMLVFILTGNDQVAPFTAASCFCGAEQKP